MRQIINLALAGVILVSLTQCKKYEDNPAITLTPREDRITNLWGFQAAYENGQNISNTYTKYDLLIKKDGTVDLDAEYEIILGTSTTVQTSGTWVFLNNDESIEFDFTDDSQDGVYQITRLTKKELRYREQGGEREMYLRSR